LHWEVGDAEVAAFASLALQTHWQIATMGLGTCVFGPHEHYRGPYSLPNWARKTSYRKSIALHLKVKSILDPKVKTR